MVFFPLAAANEKELRGVERTTTHLLTSWVISEKLKHDVSGAKESVRRKIQFFHLPFLLIKVNPSEREKMKCDEIRFSRLVFLGKKIEIFLPYKQKKSDRFVRALDSCVHSPFSVTDEYHCCAIMMKFLSFIPQSIKVKCRGKMQPDLSGKFI